MRNRTFLLLFTVHLLTRLIFILFSGLFNNYNLQPDSLWLVDFGLKASNLDFNFELERFVASPLFPVLLGMMKILFGEGWTVALILLQLFLSALSGYIVYRTSLLLFDNYKTSLLASLLFSVFPMTLWYTNTFSQECIFQVLFLLTVYFLVRALKEKRLGWVLLSAVFYSLSYLTKSHILLFAVFVPLIFFHFFKFKKETFVYSFVFATVSLVFSLPYGIYTYKKYNSYIISSNGAGYQFYLGNTEAGYRTIVDIPEKGTDDYFKVKDITVTAGYFNGSQVYYDSILSLPQKVKQEIFLKEGIEWVKRNPWRTVKLKVYDTFYFLLPGVNWHHYSFFNWLFSFITSLPVYLLSYLAVFKLAYRRDKALMPMIYIFLSMLLFSTVWYVQNRFRTITIEPFYVMYASAALMAVIEKVPFFDRRFTRISNYFHRSPAILQESEVSLQ